MPSFTTKYGIGDWIRHKTYDDKQAYGEIWSVTIYRDSVCYSTREHPNVDEKSVLEVRRDGAAR